RDFFVLPRPGPKVAPGKEAARARIVELRRAGHSIDEIGEALVREGTPLNRTGISEVVAEEGFARLWRRPEAVRGGPPRGNPAPPPRYSSRTPGRTPAGPVWPDCCWSCPPSPPSPCRAWPGPPATRAAPSSPPSARSCPCWP